jgi:hypothetical protein
VPCTECACCAVERDGGRARDTAAEVVSSRWEGSRWKKGHWEGEREQEGPWREGGREGGRERGKGEMSLAVRQGIPGARMIIDVGCASGHLMAVGERKSAVLGVFDTRNRAWCESDIEVGCEWLHPNVNILLSTVDDIWNPHTWKFHGIYLVYPRVMTIFVVRQGYTRYIPVI